MSHEAMVPSVTQRIQHLMPRVSSKTEPTSNIFPGFSEVKGLPPQVKAEIARAIIASNKDTMWGGQSLLRDPQNRTG